MNVLTFVTTPWTLIGNAQLPCIQWFDQLAFDGVDPYSLLCHAWSEYDLAELAWADVAVRYTLWSLPHGLRWLFLSKHQSPTVAKTWQVLDLVAPTHCTLPNHYSSQNCLTLDTN